MEVRGRWGVERGWRGSLSSRPGCTAPEIGSLGDPWPGGPWGSGLLRPWPFVCVQSHKSYSTGLVFGT